MDSNVCRVRSALLQTATEGTQPLDSNALAMAWASLVPWGVMALSWSLPDCAVSSLSACLMRISLEGGSGGGGG